MRQLELARAERERKRHESTLFAMQETLLQELDAPLHPEFVEHRARFSVASYRSICNKRELVRVQTEACNQARTSLLKARQEKKKFETHKESHGKQARRHEQRCEQAALDEVGGQQYFADKCAQAHED